MPETEKPFYKWETFFHLFDMMKHPKYATYTCFLAPGGLLNQPAKAMQVFETMRAVWIQVLNDKQEQTISKIKRR